LNRILVSLAEAERIAPASGDASIIEDVGRIRAAAERLGGQIRDLAGEAARTEAVASPRAALAAAAGGPSAQGLSVRISPAREPSAQGGRILVVDDDATNRDVLSRRLASQGYETASAADGREALAMLGEREFDLVLLDFMMPELSGSEVLAILKANPATAHLPVIMISAMGDTAKIVSCIMLGAEDYLPKPFDPVLLRARIGACLEKKRLRDEEQRQAVKLAAALQEAEEQKRLADGLLRNILPEQVAEELRSKGAVEPMYFEDVTIVFTDFVGFTLSTEKIAADDLVASLHEYFTAFDRIVERYGLEKLKTIGDSYMYAGGLPARSASHPVDSVLAAFDILEAVRELGRRPDLPCWDIRIGVHTGPVIAGVVGIRKFAFDVWGSAVNFASRMESSSEPGRINLSEQTYNRVRDFIDCEPRGKVSTKEKKEVEMFYARGILPALLQNATEGPPPKFLRRYRVYFQREPRSFPPIVPGA
jgi:adenylate cyclase